MKINLELETAEHTKSVNKGEYYLSGTLTISISKLPKVHLIKVNSRVLQLKDYL